MLRLVFNAGLVVSSLAVVACTTKSDGDSSGDASSGSATSGSEASSGESGAESATTDTATTDTSGGGSRHDCGGEFSNSNFGPDGMTCVCDQSFDWCDPNAPDDFECCANDSCASGMNNRINLEGSCVCDPGFQWCDPNSVTDLNCCTPP